MKNLLLRALVLIIAFNIIIGVFNHSLSYSLADANDIFNISTPNPNQRISGTFNVAFQAYDDEQSQIPMTATLLDFATCTQSIGSITSATTVPSNASGNTSINWNTNSTQTSANIADGKYCIRICLSLLNDGVAYSACHARDVIILNTNRPPVITSTPTNLTIYEDSSWQYQIVATDPDNDTLTYRIVNGANFLSINPQTGLVSTNSNSKALGADTIRADYSIVVEASDGLNVGTTQQFTLSVIRRSTTGGGTTGGGTTGGGNQTVNRASTINITFPPEDAVLSGEENVLRWVASDPDGVKEINLRYSTDGINWKDITKLAGTASTYTWDVSNIEDGTYFLQLTLIDNQNVATSKVSNKFKIQNNQPEESSPLIINVKPENGTILNELDEISGEFVPSNGANIDPDSFKISLNEQDITTNCTKDEEKFTCNVEGVELEEGSHIIAAEVSDDASKKAEITSIFTLDSSATSGGDVVQVDDTIRLAGRDIPRATLIFISLLCCALCLLILIPWVLYGMWLKRREVREESTIYSDPTVTTDYSNYASLDPSLYSYPVPTVTANYYTPPAANLSEAHGLQPTTVAATQPQVDYNYYPQPVETTPTEVTVNPPEQNITVQEAPLQQPPSFTVNQTTTPVETTTPNVTVNQNPQPAVNLSAVHGSQPGVNPGATTNPKDPNNIDWSTFNFPNLNLEEPKPTDEKS